MSGGDSKSRFGMMVRHLLVALCMTTLFVGAASSATQKDICNALEDFALAVLDGKNAGLSERAARSQLAGQDNEELANIVTEIYSRDNATADYALAYAKLRCSVVFLFAKDDGSRGKTGDQVPSDLAGRDWVISCTQSEWIKDWEKSRGRGTMQRDWRSQAQRFEEVTDKVWKNRQKLTDALYDAAPLIERVAPSGDTVLSEIARSAVECVQERMSIAPGEATADPTEDPDPADVGLSDADCSWLLDAWKNKRATVAIDRYGADTAGFVKDCRSRKK